ncbi:neuropathy target esterase sws isoform X2 [Planococcus citri]|uniref:neuropathy target esterase sws isoform X2 n=1 Tax=Planococcus citri TaxID=170843 RepID=UPI0031F8F751
MESIKKFYSNLNLVTSQLLRNWTKKFTLPYYQNAVLLTIPVILVIFIVAVYVIRRWRSKNYIQIGGKGLMSGMMYATKPRFRKRDKVMFYGRKMLRKVKSISGQVRGGQGKKRKLMLKFAHKLLRMKRDAMPQRLKVEPPVEYLQEDLTRLDEQRVPPDAFYMLQSIRVFGHFEKPVFLKLCKHIEIMNVPAGSYLFKIGDPDENVFIVQNGKINVFVTNQEGLSISLKIVKTGDSLTSLLSFADVLTGHPKPYKTVCARALEDSTVVKLPVSGFQEVFEEYPELLIRVMQVILVRLQRVTLTALHQYLGLSTELVNPSYHKKKISLFSTSPTKHRSRECFANSDNSQSSSYHEMLAENNIESSLTYQPTTTLPPDFLGLPNLLSNTGTHKQHRRSKSGIEVRHQPDLTNDIDMSASQHHDVQPTRKKTVTGETPIDETTLIQTAVDAFVKELGLEDDSLLSGKVEIREIPAGTYLMQEESHKDVALIYLMSGTLSVYQKKMDDNEEEIHLYTVYPGEIFGGLAVLTGEQSFFTIKTKHFSRIALISKTTIYGILRERPPVVLHLADTVVRRMSPFVRQVDFALDWVFIESGRALYRQDEESDSTYIVLSGRLRSVITHSDGRKELVGEYGKGDLIGIVEMVTQTRRSTTIMAVRDSELAKLPEGLFNGMKLRFPIVVTRLINLLGHRILGSWKKPSLSPSMEINNVQSNFSTIAIVPITDDVPLTSFTYELYHSLSAIGSTLRLTSEIIRKNFGPSIMDANNEYRLISWLAQQEDHYKITLYQCDSTFTLWTQRCVRQADCILIVGLGKNPPSVCRIEKEIEKLAIRTQKELVLLHHEGANLPNNTVTWLNMRSWVSSHHHIQCNKRVFTTKSQYRINELYSKVLMSEPNIHSDFSRLARWLTGTSVGLVLGGGGARGAAHVGMIKSIQEAGIPIDMVGGVSIGAFMGGLWCMERNITTVTQKARQWAFKMTHWWRQLLDLTYPVTSMFTGRDFNATIKATFNDTQIEDLWLPYFTITTDISASEMRIHTHGDLWRYVRASMTIAGVLPPMFDPSDNHLLLDGCYVNNVPADIMRSQGAKFILAIDVGSQDDADFTNYGDSLSGWWLLWKRYNPFASPIKVPNLPDIQSRLAYVSCVRQLEEVKTSNYCEYIRPPIDKYRTLQFSSFDEIREVGYNHGKTYFAGLMKAGGLPFASKATEATSKSNFNNIIGSSKSQPSASALNYTFTDLAQMVCKVPREMYVEESSSSDDYEADEEDTHEVGYVSEPSASILSNVNVLRHRHTGSLSLSENELELESESEGSILHQDTTFS